MKTMLFIALWFLLVGCASGGMALQGFGQGAMQASRQMNCTTTRNGVFYNTSCY